jgi:hypothetical protein
VLIRDHIHGPIRGSCTVMGRAPICGLSLAYVGLVFNIHRDPEWAAIGPYWTAYNWNHPGGCYWCSIFCLLNIFVLGSHPLSIFLLYSILQSVSITPTVCTRRSAVRFPNKSQLVCRWLILKLFPLSQHFGKVLFMNWYWNYLRTQEIQWTTKQLIEHGIVACTACPPYGPPML